MPEWFCCLLNYDVCYFSYWIFFMFDLIVDKKSFIPSRIFCIGRNYMAHAQELGNAIPKEPVVFMKPVQSLLPEGKKIIVSEQWGRLEYEAEIVLLVGKTGSNIKQKNAIDYVEGMTLGLDLTLRELQKKLKDRGLPWERAKAFENSAPIGQFVKFDKKNFFSNIQFSCKINGELRQNGNSKNMLFSISKLVEIISQWWELRAGDLIFTGTPSGVGALKQGDSVELSSPQIGCFSWERG